MAQIIRRKADNVVEFIFDKYDTITLEATGMTVDYGNNEKEWDFVTEPHVANSTKHLSLIHISEPTRR